MPNWNSTQYRILGERNQVENIFNKFQQVLHTDRRAEKDHSTFLPDPTWLGYVAQGLLDIDPETEKIPCRGEISWIDDTITNKEESDAYFELSTETAWSDCRELFYLLSEKYDVQILFFTTEFGCEFLQTNDTAGECFTTRFILDDIDDDTFYYDSFEELAEDINDRFGEYPTSLKDVENIIERHDLCETLHAYEVSLVSLDEF